MCDHWGGASSYTTCPDEKGRCGHRHPQGEVSGGAGTGEESTAARSRVCPAASGGISLAADTLVSGVQLLNSLPL